MSDLVGKPLQYQYGTKSCCQQPTWFEAAECSNA